MNQERFKIGYSDIGGIFVGKNICSDSHQNHLLAIILSFGEPFEIIHNDISELYTAVIVQKDFSYRLQSGQKDYTVFVHLDPYSEIGIKLSQKDHLIQKLDINLFLDVLKDFQKWIVGNDNSVQNTEILIDKIYNITVKSNPEYKEIDERILKCMQQIRKSDEDKISINQIARFINLSPSRLAHLFKEETGLTFRKYVLHCKLIKSLQAMYNQNNLTTASFMGGFSDQPHFTKTFKNAFGIKPSESKK